MLSELSKVNPKLILIIIPVVLIIGYFVIGGLDNAEPPVNSGGDEFGGISNPEAAVVEPVPEPVVEPVPEPVVSLTIISIDSLVVEGNTLTVTVSIDGEFDHWHASLDNALNENNQAGGTMVTNGLFYRFENIQPGEHTVYVGAVSSSHSLINEQVSEGFVIAELVAEEPELECPFGQEIVEEEMVLKCELFVIKEDVFMVVDGQFEFTELMIQKGVTVTWHITELDLGAGGDVPYHQVLEVNGLFDSGYLTYDKKWSYTFNETGEFVYTCPPHPWMIGKIIVVDE